MCLEEIPCAKDPGHFHGIITPLGGKKIHNSLENREFWGLQRMVWEFLECSFLRNISWWGDSCRKTLLVWIFDPWGTSWQRQGRERGTQPRGFVVHNEKLLQDNSMRDQPKPTDPECIFNLHCFALGMRLPKIPRAKESSKIPLDLPQEGFSLLQPCSWMGVLHSQGYFPHGS